MLPKTRQTNNKSRFVTLSAVRPNPSHVPSVTVAVPVLNEQEHLGACLDSIAARRFAGEIEILVADGGSSDATRSIAAAYPGVRLLDNPRRVQAAGLNVAIAAARGDIFVRV